MKTHVEINLKELLEEINLKAGVETELVGIIAMAIGQPRIEPILLSFIDTSIAIFTLDFNELR